MPSLRAQAEALRHAPLRYALCHTDIHGWNLMQEDRLILIDWEGLKLAPVEADLFSFTETFFFGDGAAEEGFFIHLPRAARGLDGECAGDTLLPAAAQAGRHPRVYPKSPA